MVVTKVPSESFEMVTETLTAMLAQSHAHDTWLADEDPTDEMIAWCEDHKVLVSCRKEFRNITGRPGPEEQNQRGQPGLFL